jgi:hypothetical protein
MMSPPVRLVERMTAELGAPTRFSDGIWPVILLGLFGVACAGGRPAPVVDAAPTIEDAGRVGRSVARDGVAEAHFSGTTDGPSPEVSLGQRPVLVPPPAPPPPPETDCTGVDDGVVTRQVEHLGAGQEVTVRLVFRDGIPVFSRDLGGCVRIEDGQGRRVPAAITKRPLESTSLLLLVDPGQTPRDAQAARQAARAILQARPATDRVGLFRWESQVTQVAPLIADRTLVEQRLDVGFAAPGAGRMPLDAALAQVKPVLERAGGATWDGLRAVVVVTPRRLDNPSQGILEAVAPFLLFLVAPEAAAAAVDVPSGLRFDLAAGVTAAGALSERIDAHRVHAHYGLGFCGDGSGLEAQMRVGEAKTGRPLVIWPGLHENLAGRCDWEAVAAGRRSYPGRIEFLFTPEQRRLAEAAFGTATAHYRGNSSLKCMRPNYTLKLSGRAPRFLMPGAAGSQYLLISMCLDRAYLRTMTAAQILAEEGLFPGPFELVELVIDGQSQGVYFLAERTTEWIRREYSGLSGVVRRITQSGGTGVEVSWSAITPREVVTSYERILRDAGGASAGALEQALRGRLHLDQYLSWIAVMTTLASGDYVDEVFFVGFESVGADGKPTTLHSVLTWDADDIFNPCHAGGRNAIEDANGLLYCAEAELDKRMFADDHLYRRYVDALEAVLARLTPARFDRALEVTMGKLLTRFQDSRIRSAMTELRSIHPRALTSYQMAHAVLEAEALALAGAFERNHQELRARVARFRGGQ